MGKINTTNYPNRPVSSYQDDDMFILQDNGGETYTTNVGDIKTLIDNKISGKADKVSSATAGHLAGLDANGNLTDSGISVSNGTINATELVTSDGVTANDISYFNEIDLDGSSIYGVGTLNVNQVDVHDGQAVEFLTDITVNGAVADEDGNVLSNKTDKVTNATSGNLAGLDANGNLTDSGVSPTEDVTVEGNPVTFDSPFEQDAKSVVVSVKPIQDLHGYDHPWVGGASANVLNPYDGAGERNSVTWTPIVDTGNNKLGYTVNGTASTHTPVIPFSLPIVNAEKTYNIQYFDFDSPQGVAKFGWDSTAEAQLANVDSGTIIVPANHEVYIGIYINPNQAISNIKLQVMVSESTITDFIQYSNICPISGIDEVEIEVSGKNLCGNWKDNTVIIYTDGSFYPQNGYKTCDFIRVSQGQKIYIQSNNIGGEKWWYTKDKTPYEWVGNGVGVKISPIDGYFAMSVSDANASTTMVEYGENGSEYEPYKGSTTTIPLPSTLYDADVDVTNGDADNRFGMVDLANLNWTAGNPYYTSNDIASTAKIPAQSVKPNAMAEEHNVVARINIDNAGDLAINTDGVIYVRTSTRPSGKLVYELATPTTLSFDPTDVELLEGTNVVSTNAEKVAVTYGRSLWQDIDDLKSDTEGKLDKSDVADVEGDTASKAYSVNDFMLRADGLYKVTAPIASGASITASNTTKTTIGAVLTALLNS